MRHRHVPVTLEAETVAAIEDRLEGGETVSAWVAEAARRRLDGDRDRDGDQRPPYEFVDDCAI